MISEIIKEKTSADHLLYVSLKYTKTCDVILNLIERWKSMMEISFDYLLERALKKKIIPHIAKSPKQKIEFMRKIFRKNQVIQDAVTMYIFFKRIPGLKKEREGEFRKNVNLKIIEEEKITNINMDQLKDYAEKLEKFISEVKHSFSS